MVTARKRGKRSAGDAALAPTAGEDDAYLIQRTRKTEIEEYDEDAFIDLYGGEIDGVKEMHDDCASKYDGQTLVKDAKGSVLVFKNIETANIHADEEWEAMQNEIHEYFGPAPEEEQQISTRSPRKKVLTDGRVTFSRKQKIYVGDGVYGDDEIKHIAISNIKVEVIKASIIA